ncbi:P-loop containing nucleoside triphosphate hydrolase protein [Coemansia reversa NRRL 1564]|uniref:P-loop containing nucleoside triphosphate hydrolase protein n=1 Tax=Coemansia reversa (strain ATCC 12441 / NRRL 1564) TaxID=763665 RepID=A0A2G5BA65_COERN|nr:P-loop containing nucleoside triphosphate hydrolase protein [Coemansia reversa NRRL 1564]|eukprot:PIA15905.1 P-loop containing nucleoside triphosphate hydrolase protein [Coemansia reversa NRRL 1564]
MEDLYETPYKYSLGASWRRYYSSARRRDSLMRRIITTFKYEILAQVILNPLNVVLDYMQPVLIQQLLRFITNYSSNPLIGLRYGFFLAIAMLFFSLASTAIQQQQDWGARTLLMHIRNTLVGLLTQKTLRRRTKGAAVAKDPTSEYGQSDESEGRAYNVLSTDIQRMASLIKLLRASMLMPIQLLIGAYYMYNLLGTAGVLGTMVLMLAVFMTRTLIFRAKCIEVVLGKLNDRRLTVINEVVRGIVSVKLFGWGSRFVRIIGCRRKEQLVWLWKRAKVRSLINLCTLGSLPFVSFATFVVYSKRHTLDAESIFTAIAVFKIIQRSVESMPLLIADSTAFYVSFRRIETYLDQQEVQPLDERVARNAAQDVVGFENATLLWDASTYTDEAVDDETFKLRNLDVWFPRGGLTLIGGSTGSGKSSLLAALVGEMELINGCVRVPVSASTDEQPLGSLSSAVINDIAYVPQEPWLRNATIRDNILFGEPYNHERYENVLHMCALLADLHIFAAGDMAEVGERGITLSGGQRQRISLARAIYSQRKILLIDDCLSAVDAQTARHILHKCLLSADELMNGRTCLLVTHHMAICLPHCDFVVLMQGGRIAFQGTSTDHIPSSGVDVDGDTDLIYSNLGSRYNSYVSITSDTENSNGKLIQEEVRNHGLIKLETWKTYFAPCGGLKFVLACLGCIGTTQFLAMYKDYYLAKRLGSKDITSTNHLLSEPPTSVMSWLIVYLSFGMLSAIISSLALLLTYSGSLKASATLHDDLISSIVSAMPRFLDTTPIGRIMARFSRDMQAVDDDIMVGLNNIMRPLISLIITLITISSVVPLFAVVGLIVLALYAHFTWQFIKALRNSKRLESTTFAPIISLYSEMIPGGDSIRAFAMESAYMREMEKRYSSYLSAEFSRRSMTRWMRIRIGIVSSFVTFITAWFILANIDTISSGLAGFILIYTVNFWTESIVIVRKYGDLELSLNSVERIHQYLDIDHEAPAEMPADDALAAGWPNTGKLNVRELVAGYTEHTPVLNKLSFAVGHGKRVGVVGRTGAGKSSLSLALLRMIEASNGSVELDGVDIAGVGLERLRQSITIIPQNPVLFNGTVRLNLDPFGKYSDPLLIDALQRTLLLKGSPANERTTVAAFESLDDIIADGGQNLSLGQRQLMALARALVRRSRLVIMDEATASVDFETDKSIQRTIRGIEFSDSTLLCIAHRLRTIIDYDYILVLDEGKVVEFDTPACLIKKKDGYFYRLCKNSNEFEMLQELACGSNQE